MTGREALHHALSVVLLSLGLAALLFAVTELPYRAKVATTPPGGEFLGQVALVSDSNMYFSFIRQGAEGHWLFRNRLTHVEHAPAFANLQFLAVGRAMAAFGLSQNATWKLWRFAGAWALVLGFWLLARAHLRDRRWIAAALLLFAVGGGFGWVTLLLETIGVVQLEEPRYLISHAKLDIEAALHPFTQIMLNPNFSLPTGFLLSFLALVVRAETRDSPGPYLAAALVALAQGFMRPYDLISLWVALPLFSVWQIWGADPIPWKRTLWRALPLIATTPALAYHVWLFTLHPVFRHWASQGDMSTWAGMGWQLLAMGVAGGLALLRLALCRRHPLLTSERLLASWVFAILALAQAHRVLPFIPFSPQIAIPLSALLLLLGAGALRFWPANPKRRLPALLLLGALAAPSSALALAHFSGTTWRGDRLYAPRSELGAFRWLGEHASADDVIFASLESSNRMAKYLSPRVAVGHWSATPDVRRLRRLSNAFFDGRLSPTQAFELLAMVEADWIYVGPAERRLALRTGADPDTLSGLSPKPAYREGESAIYRVPPAAGRGSR